MQQKEPIELSDEQFEDELKRSVLNTKNHSDCCCSCKNQKELRKHPSNKDFGKGSIMDSCGWVCVHPEMGLAVYSDRQHGSCEYYSKK